MICSDNRVLDQFKTRQADHLAWTPDGRAVFVWLEHAAIVTKTICDVYPKNMGIPYMFEIPMEHIDPLI